MCSWHVYLFCIFTVICVYLVCVCLLYSLPACLWVQKSHQKNLSMHCTRLERKRIISNCGNMLITKLIWTLKHTHTHLWGLKWRGSERSLGSCGSRVRAEPQSSSEEPEGFRERPGRVEDEAGHAAEEGSKERLSGGLYGAMASFLQCGPGLVEREEWALEDLLWPPWLWPLALAWW